MELRFSFLAYSLSMPEVDDRCIGCVRCHLAFSPWGSILYCLLLIRGWMSTVFSRSFIGVGFMASSRNDSQSSIMHLVESVFVGF